MGSYIEISIIWNPVGVDAGFHFIVQNDANVRRHWLVADCLNPKAYALWRMNEIKEFAIFAFADLNYAAALVGNKYSRNAKTPTGLIIDAKILKSKLTLRKLGAMATRKEFRGNGLPRCSHYLLLSRRWRTF